MPANISDLLRDYPTEQREKLGDLLRDYPTEQREKLEDLIIELIMEEFRGKQGNLQAVEPRMPCNREHVSRAWVR